MDDYQNSRRALLAWETNIIKVLLHYYSCINGQPPKASKERWTMYIV